MTVTQAQSDAMILAASRAAVALGVPMNVAVLDSGAQLKAFLRMDGALLGSIDVAVKKARTAVLFGMNSEAVGEYCRPGGTSPGLDQTNGGLVVFAGGIPLHSAAGELIGAIGVSGGSVVQDAQVAIAAAAAKSDGEVQWAAGREVEPLSAQLLPSGS